MRYSMIRAQLCFMALLVAIALATDRGLSSTFGRPSLPAQAVLARLTAQTEGQRVPRSDSIAAAPPHRRTAGWFVVFI